MKHILALLLSFTILLGFQWAHGHALLTSPIPRNNNDSLKLGPCGNVPKTANPTTFQMGSTITVTWAETINHPGSFIFSFTQAADDTGFENNVLATFVDNQNGNINRNDPTTWHRYSEQITLPNLECANCSLQMIQVMTEDPANPRNYYSCADIILAADINNPPTPEPVPPTPNPNPTPQPNSGGDATALDTSSQSNSKAPEMGGCFFGSVKPPRSGGSGGSAAFLLALPLFLLVRLQKRLIPKKYT